MQRTACRLLAASWAAACNLALSSSWADEPPLRDVVDQHIHAAWQQQGIEPAGPASDAEFLRRIYLDLVGTIPTYDDAVAFLDDPSPDKRSALIDRLLEDPGYAQHQADVWDMVLFGRHPPGYQTDQRDGFLAWLRGQFANNVPYHRIVEQLLRAEGNTVDHGAPMYLVQYRNAPEDAAVAITQTFLGVQLQCARCHDHPYEPWTQLDFFGMAAFLARLQVVDVGRQGNLTKYMIGERRQGELMFSGPAAQQQPGQQGSAVQPKFLHGDVLEEPAVPAGFQEPRNFPSGKEPPRPDFSRKDALAAWVASPDNPYLARAVANRVWAQFLGRGLVHPVDNMSASNKPSHPQLLDELARRLREREFDLRWYIRELVHSQTYQLSSSGPVADPRPQWFQQARWRPLSAEELAAAWRVATGYDAALAAAGKEPKSRFEGLTGGYMLRFFGEPTDGVGNFQGGLHEQLYLNNGEVTRLISTDRGSLYHTLMNSSDPWEARVDRLFLSILTRRPDEQERQAVVAYLTADDKTSDRLREAIWALLTCSEFRFNH
jgi:hypothetical protein